MMTFDLSLVKIFSNSLVFEKYFQVKDTVFKFRYKLRIVKFLPSSHSWQEKVDVTLIFFLVTICDMLFFIWVVVFSHQLFDRAPNGEKIVKVFLYFTCRKLLLKPCTNFTKLTGSWLHVKIQKNWAIIGLDLMIVTS